MQTHIPLAHRKNAWQTFTCPLSSNCRHYASIPRLSLSQLKKKRMIIKLDRLDSTRNEHCFRAVCVYGGQLHIMIIKRCSIALI